MIVRTAAPSDATAAAALHASQIREGFLPTLGTGFLSLLYRRIVAHSGAFLLVTGEPGAVVGFAAGCENLGRLYREFLVRDGARAVVRAAPRMARSWRPVLETLRYPGGDDAGLPPAELVSVAVAAGAQGRGLGRELVSAALEEFRRRGIESVRVVAGAENAAALGLYKRCGFKPAGRLEVHRGAPSEVLTWP